MAILTGSITSSQKFQIVASPQDATGNPGSLPGPLAWDLLNDSLGMIAVTADSLTCLFTPAPGVEGLAKIVVNDPAAPGIPTEEADITVTLPPAQRLVLTGSVV